jgi:uridine phosphorylase
MAEAFNYDLELAEAVVLVFDTSLVPARSTTRTQRRARHPFRSIGTLAEGVDIVVAAGPGAPVAAITVDFLVHFGAKRIIAVGSAGVLAPTEPAPHHIVIERAESDEGTSAHYSADLHADVVLTTALVALVGASPRVTVTTDVPFRHTPARLAAHRARASVIEMECAALFASANAAGIAAAALLVPSDTFGTDRWVPAEVDLSANMQTAVTTATQALLTS